MGDIPNELLASLRLRTERRRKRDAIDDKNKQLIRLYREDKNLRKQKMELPMIELVPPIQRGWKRYFIVREDVRRSKVGTFYENLLQKINTVQYNSDKAFKVKKKRKGRRIYEAKEQLLKVIYFYELSKFKFTERESECFELKTIREVRFKTIYEKQIYVFKEPWRYILRICPNMIDKVKAHDNELEQRLAEVNAKVWHNSKRGKIIKLGFARSYRWKNFENTKYLNPLKNVACGEIEELMS
jgi:hypothetical protein